MPDLINGRTPEEIRKGLECCALTGKCSECTYKQVCDEHLANGGDSIPTDLVLLDIFTYVKQLLQENTALRADLKEADAIECSHCLHFRTEEQTDPCIEADYDCDSCKNEECKCRSCREGNPNWERRGIQKDMKEEER